MRLTIVGDFTSAAPTPYLLTLPILGGNRRDESDLVSFAGGGNGHEEATSWIPECGTNNAQRPRSRSLGSGPDGRSSHHHERHHSCKHAEECLASQAYFGRGELGSE
jgi:hypothetical protein